MDRKETWDFIERFSVLAVLIGFIFIALMRKVLFLSNTQFLLSLIAMPTALILILILFVWVIGIPI